VPPPAQAGQVHWPVVLALPAQVPPGTLHSLVQQTEVLPLTATQLPLWQSVGTVQVRPLSSFGVHVGAVQRSVDWQSLGDAHDVAHTLFLHA
jgi:hypothetical protein